jgi:hypothetical protein
VIASTSLAIPGTTPSSQRWPLVPGRKPVQEEHTTDQDENRRAVDAGQQGAWPEVRMRLNRLLGGWSAYFSYGALASAYEALSINMSMTARVTSCANGTKCKDVAQTSSPETMSPGSWRCAVFGASANGRRRGPYDEASRKARCGKSACPVVCPVKAGVFSRR